jgi:hypothetical protein
LPSAEESRSGNFAAAIRRGPNLQRQTSRQATRLPYKGLAARVLVMAWSASVLTLQRFNDLTRRSHFFLKRFGFFPFVGGEQINNQTLTKN